MKSLYLPSAMPFIMSNKALSRPGWLKLFKYREEAIIGNQTKACKFT